MVATPDRRKLALLLPLSFFLTVVLFFRLRDDEGEKEDPPVVSTHLGTENSEALPAGESIFHRFQSWMESYRTAGPKYRKYLEREGFDLAARRRAAMESLIRFHPEEALARSLSIREREVLPREIRDHIEQPFSTFAEMDVFPLCPPHETHGPGATGKPERPDPAHVGQGGQIEISSEKLGRLDSYVYGSRAGSLSRDRIPLQGIRLGNVAALEDDVFRLIPEDRVDEMLRIYPVGVMTSKRDFLTGEEIGGHPVVALSGGRLHFFKNQDHIDELNRTAKILEKNIGPGNGSQLLFTARETLEHEPVPLSGLVEEAEEAAALSVASTRTAVAILIDFSDAIGSPVDASTLQDRFDGEVNDQFAAMSYLKTGIDATVHSQVVRMPRPTSYYNGSDDGEKKNGELFDDAMAAAAGLGIETSGYDHRCLVFTNIGFGYCGLATVGGSKVWMQCHPSKLIVHEMAHNLGLHHAAWWDSTSSDPVDPNGISLEYGDNTDLMGGGDIPTGHFHVQAKNTLGWLEDDQRYLVGPGHSVGSYRIYQFDRYDTDLSHWKRAIRITKGSDEYYWVGYRRLITGIGFENYEKGVQLHWQQPGKEKSWLVDTSPATTKNDSGLALGKTFSDPVAGIHITSLRQGGSSPNEWIDVQVNVGDFSDNRSPVATLNLPDRYPVHASVPMGALASDPDGDDMAYFFEVGNGIVPGSDGTIDYRDHAWNTSGTRPVTLNVTDGKGGTVTVEKNISIQPGIDAPSSVTASDEEFSDKVRVSWHASEGAASYAVYRADSDEVYRCEVIGTTTGTEYDDYTVEEVKRYYYWVQALASGECSRFAGPDEGTRDLLPPEPPSDFSATKNQYTGRVLVNWTGWVAAGSYQVLRSEVNDIGSASIIGEGPEVYFNDRTAVPGVRYFYWVRAIGAAGNETTDSDYGSRKLSAPTGLAASDGDESGEVNLNWNLLPGADGYRVYRSSTSGAPGVMIAEISEQAWRDTPPYALQPYYYTVAGYTTDGGEGEMSLSDPGFRIIAGPEAVSASVLAFDDRIRVSWDPVAVPGEYSIEYEIWRSVVGYSSVSLIGTATGLTYDDFTAKPGLAYQYSVRAKEISSELDGVFSATVIGTRSTVPPFQPDLAIGRGRSLKGNGVYSPGGAGQRSFQRVKRKRPVSWKVMVQNDGIFEDSLRLNCSGRDRYFSPLVRESGGASQNVTAAAKTGRYRLNGIAPLEEHYISFSLRPSRMALRRKVRKLYKIDASSAGDSTHRDKVLPGVKTVVKRKRPE